MKEKIRKEEAKCKSIDPNTKYALEPGERLLHHEPSEIDLNSLDVVLIAVFAVIGFPFYVWLLVVGAGGLLSGANYPGLVDEVSFPAMALAVEATVLLILAPILRAKSKSQEDKSELVITTRRIFYSNLTPSFIYNPSAGSAAFLESRFDQALFVATDRKHGYLKIKTRDPIPREDEPSEKVQFYKVKDIQKAYSYLPQDLVAKKGEASAEGRLLLERERRDNIVACIVFAFIVAFLILVGGLAHVQESARKLMQEGRTAYAHGRYKLAEEKLFEAHELIGRFPASHQYYGPSCYRLALAYKANGKGDLAIPLFLEAVSKCNWSDSESSITWKPAVFRSYSKLGDIYREKGDTKSALLYYKNALDNSNLETDLTRVKQATDQYAELLKQEGKEKLSRAIEESLKFVQLNSGRAFFE